MIVAGIRRVDPVSGMRETSTAELRSYPVLAAALSNMCTNRVLDLGLHRHAHIAMPHDHGLEYHWGHDKQRHWKIVS